MSVSPSGKGFLQRYLRLYIGGYDLSGDSRTFGSAAGTFGEVDLTGWNELARNFLADGRLETGLTGYQALMNDAANRSLAELQLTAGSPNATQLSLCFGNGGEPAVSDPAYVLPSIQFGDMAAFEGGAAVLSADFKPDAGQYTSNYQKPFGVVLQGPTSLTETLAASSANTVDNGAGTTGGGVAILHVLATSSGNFSFKLRDSTDDSSFADLVDFTLDGSAVGSELVSFSGAVDRYVGLSANRSAGSVTAVVTFVRN